jgi:hypothetical protein
MQIDRAHVERIITTLLIEVDFLRAELGDRASDQSVRQLAEMFCMFDDDAQAKFFSYVADIMKRWGPGKDESQAWHIGRHMATCECATDGGREFIHTIEAAITIGNVRGVVPHDNQ